MSRRIIHRLLAGRRGLTRTEKDDLFAAVMQEVDPGRPRRRLAPLLALIGAAAALLLVPLVLRRADQPEALVARGGAASATFSAFCAAGPCRVGDTLLLDIAPGGWGHFAAFARRDDGTIIWYRAAEDAASAAVSPGVLPSGIVLDDAHRPGTYRVYGIFSRAPLARAEIRARFLPEADGAAASAGADTAVVVRELVVR